MRGRRDRPPAAFTAVRAFTVRPRRLRRGFWGPLALGGIIVGAELYNRPERVEVVPVPVPQMPVVPQAAPAVPAQQYAWYWCPTARAFYPGVATCPVQWEVVMGTSATNPPQPPQ